MVSLAFDKWKKGLIINFTLAPKKSSDMKFQSEILKVPMQTFKETYFKNFAQLYSLQVYKKNKTKRKHSYFLGENH